MVRFFTLGIWEVVAHLGYTHVLRLDEDSFLWSPITYNIFAFMHKRHLDYGYRLGGWERPHETRHSGDMDIYHATVRSYVLENDLDARWLLDTCSGSRSAYNFSVYRCGNIYTIYNNFFVTRVGFWLRPDVQAFLRYVNRTETIYYDRLGDALWHSTAAALFMDEQRLHMFHDFAYEHATMRTVPVDLATRAGRVASNGRNATNRTCLHYGGMILPLLGPARIGMQGQHRFLAILRMAAEGHCDDALSLKKRACLHATADGALRGVWAGTGMSVEQARCGLEPEPYHCALSPNSLLPTSTEPTYMGADAISLSDAQQKRHVCANWCPSRPKLPAAVGREAFQREHHDLIRNASACVARTWRLWIELLKPGAGRAVRGAGVAGAEDEWMVSIRV